MISDYTAQLDFYPVWSSLPPNPIELDPFDYEGRLGVYKLLIDALSGAFGAENELNPLWSGVFQLAWMWRSGRLVLPDTPPGRIHAHSVWGYLNHTVSVIPLIAAINEGIVKPIRILAPYDHGVIDYAHGGSQYVVPDAFSYALPAWSKFFQQASQLRSGDPLEPLRFTLWKAYEKSLEAAKPTIEARAYHYLSRTELSFLYGWMRMMSYLGAAAWRTDLDFIRQHGFGMLPERVLSSDDHPGRIRGMSAAVNINLRTIVKLNKLSNFNYRLNLFLWKRAMRSAGARADALNLLHAAFNPVRENRRERLRILGGALKP